MVFVSSPLNGDNYLVWSRAMRFALRSRMKRSFIDGRSVRPPDDSPDLDEWIRKDYLVITWILNNVSKTIMDTFMYVTSARSLGWSLRRDMIKPMVSDDIQLRARNFFHFSRSTSCLYVCGTQRHGCERSLTSAHAIPNGIEQSVC
ncbi:UNVERIFIED_CONTAM: hypothetical protein Sradi_0198100 [Sesamum radiatum]|uniref:Retrotransposon Copia-like N-terminal domain-containing protein n=1 Tax=Sesamum radiatum TaxID=300843 RepID=A0AAW2VZX7_SESRA